MEPYFRDWDITRIRILVEYQKQFCRVVDNDGYSTIRWGKNKQKVAIYNGSVIPEVVARQILVDEWPIRENLLVWSL